MLSDFAKPYIQASLPALREHGLTITSTFYRNMFGEHPELRNLFNMGNQAQGVQQQSLASAVFAYAANFENPDALTPVVSRIAHKHASLGITSEHYPIVGRHLLGAIKQVLGEAATPELIEAWAEAYGALADVLVEEERKLYQSAGQQPGVMQPMRVVQGTAQGADGMSYQLVPVDGSGIPDFQPGQYVSVAVKLPSGLRQLRQYSLSDAPGKPYLQITVKRITGDDTSPKGQVSNWLHANIKTGDTLDTSAPFGDFQVDVSGSKPVVLLAAGVGITPMVAALNHAVEVNPQLPLHLLYAMRNAEQFMHKADIDHALHAMPNMRFRAFVEDVEGHMTLDALPQELLQQANFYMCGPLGFMQAQRQSLLERGVPAERIHREVFGPDLLDHLL
jgi:nitric oxide dioxygenase